MNRKNRQSRALFLFGQCYSPDQVAHKLDISYKEAKKIHAFYLYSQKLDDEMEKDITAYYEEKLEHTEAVGRIIKKVKEERQKDFNCKRISKDSSLFTEFLLEGGHQVTEIFFYDSFGKSTGCWAKNKWERSPFWINFESRFYSREYSCYLFN